MARRREQSEADGSANDKPAHDGEPTFEESLGRLEEIAEQLEEGQLGLGESLASYEEGIHHLKVCHELLARAERKIELLAGLDDQGNAITKAFDDTATTLEKEAAPSKARRGRAETPPARTVPKPRVEDVDDEELLF